MIERFYASNLTAEMNIDLLHRLTEVLLDKEVIDGKELDELVREFKSKDFPTPWERPIGSEGSVALRNSSGPKDT